MRIFCGIFSHQRPPISYPHIYQAEGEGNGKKTSKKRAAITMLNELRQLPPLSPVIVSSVPVHDANGQAIVGSGDQNNCEGGAAAIIHMSNGKKKSASAKKKTRNLIKEEGTEPDDTNPISRLIRVSQAHKAKEPLYELIDESGTPRRREFIFQVTAINGVQAIGAGTTKKKARRQAAESEFFFVCEQTTTARACTNTILLFVSDLLELLDLDDKTDGTENKENQGNAAAAAAVAAAMAAAPGQFDSPEDLVPLLLDNLRPVVLDPNDTSVLQPSSSTSFINNSDNNGNENGTDESGHVRPTQLLLSLAKLSKFNVSVLFSLVTLRCNNWYLTCSNNSYRSNSPI